jgi:hypothetical protein
VQLVRGARAAREGPPVKKVAFSILLQPDGRWHWVMRLWEQGPDKICTLYAAKASHESAPQALSEALRERAQRSGPELNT